VNSLCTAHTASDGETKDSVTIISAVLLGASMVLCILMAVILGAIFSTENTKVYVSLQMKKYLPCTWLLYMYNGSEMYAVWCFNCLTTFIKLGTTSFVLEEHS